MIEAILEAVLEFCFRGLFSIALAALATPFILLGAAFDSGSYFPTSWLVIGRFWNGPGAALSLPRPC